MSHDSSELEDELPPLHRSGFRVDHDDDGDGNGNDDNAVIRRVYTPPPNIAARLSTGNRRRSSAASSRRNSLSSKSNSSAMRASFRTHHVAQHLRRASILESRKARLAERAAHVEEVRQRASLARTAERVSTTQERTLAAQQARENLLAKVADKCAEEVNHAKRVAEEMKERRAAEEQKVRQRMQDKHAEAERRALEYKRAPRKPRATSLPSPTGKKHDESLDTLEPSAALSDEVAATRIQRAWRRRRRRLHLKHFLDIELSIDRVRKMGFMEASALLADLAVIEKVHHVMVLFGVLPAAHGGNDDGNEEAAHSKNGTGSRSSNSSSNNNSNNNYSHSNTPDRTTVRRFLSAYMILGHPTDIFTKQGQQEQNLIEMAKELLISFGAVVAHASSTPDASAPSASLQTLSQAHDSYLAAFGAWKSRDASVLIATMVDQFVALDAIWQTVKDDTRGEVADDYRDGIRNQQVILLSKIKKLAGSDQANVLIKKAIRESRRTRVRQRPRGDARPRPVAAADAGSAGPTSATAASMLHRDNSSAAAAAGTGTTSSTTENQADVDIGELSRIFSVIPSNRVLVHELRIDPAYKVDVSPHSDVRNVLNREICDRMRAAVHDGHGDVWTLAVADNIGQRLLKLLKPGNSMHRLLAEVLDLDHIRRQCEQGVFSYQKFFSFMADLLPRLCAPIRDDQVQAFATVLRAESNGGGDDANVDTMIEKLFGLLHIIDVMSLDYTNYMLQQAAPTLLREADGFEQRAFDHDLAAGAVTLERTKRWWHHAAVNLLTDQASLQQPPAGADFRSIYARGLVELAMGLGPLRPDDVPETLGLDAARLAALRADTLRIAAVGAILLTAKNLLKRDVRTQWKPEAKRIMDSIRAAPDWDNADRNLGMRIGAIVETSHGMPQSSREQLAGVINRFLAECRAARITDPVLKLLFQRLKMHVFSRVAAVTSQERVRVASTASEGLAGIGLSEFIGQVSDMSQLLVRILDVDLAAHRHCYRQVEDELARMGAAEA